MRIAFLCWSSLPANINLTVSSPLVLNNVISEHGDWGVYSRTSSSTPTIRNNTIYGSNNGVIWAVNGSIPTISQYIIWGNGDDLLNCSATYSCIEDADAGQGNIFDNPALLNPAGGDYHLTANLSCRDAGDPVFVAEPGEADVDGQLRIMNGHVDFGADEFGVFALADFDRDGDVNSDGFDLFQACASGSEIPYTGDCWDKDFNDDNDDQSDFGIFQRCYSGQRNPADPNCAD